MGTFSLFLLLQLSPSIRVPHPYIFWASFSLFLLLHPPSELRNITKIYSFISTFSLFLLLHLNGVSLERDGRTWILCIFQSFLIASHLSGVEWEIHGLYRYRIFQSFLIASWTLISLLVKGCPFETETFSLFLLLHLLKVKRASPSSRVGGAFSLFLLLQGAWDYEEEEEANFQSFLIASKLSSEEYIKELMTFSLFLLLHGTTYSERTGSTSPIICLSVFSYCFLKKIVELGKKAASALTFQSFSLFLLLRRDDSWRVHLRLFAG